MADEKEEGLDEASDAKASVGDIFGVSAGKKRKKKPKPEPEPAPSELDDDSVPFEATEKPSVDPEATLDADLLPVDAKLPREDKAAPRKKPKKDTSAVDGVLRPGGSAPAPSNASDDFLSPSDLGDYDAPKSKTVPMLVGIIAVLLLVIVGGGIMATGQADDLVALFKGELREKRIAEARMKEEQFEAEQLAKLDTFGNLMISGNPQYALVKLDGQMQYGRTSQGWREVRVGTSAGVQDLKVKETHQIEFSAPGFEPTTIEVTEGKWQEVPGSGYSYAVTPSLLPVSVHAKQEFDARMSEDVDNEYFGKITINSMPSGAKIVFNNKPLLNEKGEELVTPVTFDKYYEKDEKTGKLEEKQVKVDTALDVGHKIQAYIEYESTCPEGATTPPQCGTVDNCCPDECDVATDSDCKWPKYVTSLTRPMWTCTWNTDDGQPPAEIPKGKTIQHFCDYSFTLDLDFNGLKNYIVAREEERKRIMDQYKAAMGPDAGTAEAPESASAE